MIVMKIPLFLYKLKVYGGGLIKNKKTVRNPINKTTKSINKRKGVYKRTNKTKK